MSLCRAGRKNVITLTMLGTKQETVDTVNIEGYNHQKQQRWEKGGPNSMFSNSSTRFDGEHDDSDPN